MVSQPCIGYYGDCGKVGLDTERIFIIRLENLSFKESEMLPNIEYLSTNIDVQIVSILYVRS